MGCKQKHERDLRWDKRILNQVICFINVEGVFKSISIFEINNLYQGSTVILPFLRADQACTNSSWNCSLLSICTTLALKRINLSKCKDDHPYYCNPSLQQPSLVFYGAYRVNIKFFSISYKAVYGLASIYFSHFILSHFLGTWGSKNNKISVGPQNTIQLFAHAISSF